MQGYTLVEVDGIKSLQPGTQIAVRCEFANLHPSLGFFFYSLISSEKYYYHHGIYLGDNEVVHFSGNNKHDACPRKCDILQFINGASGEKKQLYRVQYDENVELLPQEETLRKAQKVLEEPSKWPGYQIIKNDCESFARWLKTNVSWSAQATMAAIKIIPLVAVVSGVSSLVCPSLGQVCASAVILSPAMDSETKMKKDS